MKPSLSDAEKKQHKALTQRAKEPISDDLAYEAFEPVHSLVAEHYAKYEETGNLKRCLKELGNAILSISRNIGKKPLDTESDTA